MKLDWMEESIGETFIRIIVAGIGFIGAIAVCIAQLVSGEILTGAYYYLITKDSVQAGKIIWSKKLRMKREA